MKSLCGLLVSISAWLMVFIAICWKPEFVGMLAVTPDTVAQLTLAVFAATTASALFFLWRHKRGAANLLLR